MSTSNPTIQCLGNSYRFTYTEGVELVVDHIRETRDGISSYLFIKNNNPGFPPCLHHGSFSLTTPRSRTELRNKLEAYRIPDVDWSIILELVTLYLVEEQRRREPTCILSSDDDYVPPEYLLHPLLPKGEETIIFGPRESGKSYLALVIGLCAQMPWTDNPFRFATLPTSTRILYLDWETGRKGMGWRIKSLSKGLGVGSILMDYKECRRPLEEMVDSLQADLAENNVGLVIIDSLGKACDGDLNAADTALRFWRALRRLNTTCLIIAHTSKGEDKRNTVFGSSFFENDPRYIWEVRKQQEVGEDEINIGLYHYKSNISKKFPPLGFNIRFNGDATYVSTVDIEDVPQLAAAQTGSFRIQSYLRDAGTCHAKEMAEELGIDLNAVSHTLRRGQGKWCSKLDTGQWSFIKR